MARPLDPLAGAALAHPRRAVPRLVRYVRLGNAVVYPIAGALVVRQLLHDAPSLVLVTVWAFLCVALHEFARWLDA